MLKAYVFFVVLLCVILTGCTGVVKEESTNKNGNVSFKSNSFATDKEIAVFYVDAKKSSKIKIPYQLKGTSDNSSLVIKVGLRISESQVYDGEGNNNINNTTHSFVYKKQLKHSRNGIIEFVPNKTGNYAIILSENNNLATKTESVSLKLDLPK